MKKVKVLIAHAKNEDNLAELLAEPIRQAGYEVSHEGTLLVGDSVVKEATKLLNQGAPLVIAGTEKAMGSRWTRKLVEAARVIPGTRIFGVQIEEDADIEAIILDEAIACYWRNPDKAIQDLIASLVSYYPPHSDPQKNLRVHDLESRYRELALKACDIIDLANLPEDDRHLASRELELRRLYVALRLRLEIQAGDNVSDATLIALERRRDNAWSDIISDDDDGSRVNLGERLQEAKRLVVLGDPGAGKSTLLRWLATAYLLRLKNTTEWKNLPDVATLPDIDWLPILIRCRDLPQDTDSLDSMLQHSLRKSELAEEQCHDLRELLRGKLHQGTALLLIDGLDEITDSSTRTRFSQQLEQIHRAFPDAPIVVTSRIVGYREMGYRIRAGFEHLTVADLSRKDKDDFARRWCTLTEPGDRKEVAAEELIHDIHSLDRIERLTGNPMLLTTMALIKRKIGRLPQRRVDLYEKAVEVLLNWRSAVDAPLDPREALPQLEYLAHAMCADGIQQLREDQIFELLRRVRIEYPNIHTLSQHTPEEFLGLLERRTGLLIQSGLTRHNGRSVPVYEFRHLTFQEYLAGIALVQGHYRERNKDQTLAEAIAPLAGQIGKNQYVSFEKEDYTVVENWREPLRLCLAACNDDDVDDALRAILNPLPSETDTSRPRAVLAGLCLSDEPNVSEEVAREVLKTLAHHTDFNYHETSLDLAASELGNSRWYELFCEYLLDEFLSQEADQRTGAGGLYGSLRASRIPQSEQDLYNWLTTSASKLSPLNEREATNIALAIMQLAWEGGDYQIVNITDQLIKCVLGTGFLRHAAVWALAWMNDKKHGENAWHPNQQQLTTLLLAAEDPDCDCESIFWLSWIFAEECPIEAIDSLSMHLPNSPARTANVIAEALGKIGSEKAIKELTKYLTDENWTLRRAAWEGLAQSCTDKTDMKLMSKKYMGFDAWLDPLAPISTKHIKRAAKKLDISEDEVRQRYAILFERFGITFRETDVEENNEETEIF
jgi:energy-coupling factor transporter ATP-binding protein EcfA2